MILESVKGVFWKHCPQGMQTLVTPTAVLLGFFVVVLSAVVWFLRSRAATPAAEPAGGIPHEPSSAGPVAEPDAREMARLRAQRFAPVVDATIEKEAEIKKLRAEAAKIVENARGSEGDSRFSYRPPAKGKSFSRGGGG